MQWHLKLCVLQPFQSTGRGDEKGEDEMIGVEVSRHMSGKNATFNKIKKTKATEFETTFA